MLRRRSPFALQKVVDSLLDVGSAHVLPIPCLPTDMSAAAQPGINIDTVLSLTGSPIRRAVHYVGILVCQAEHKPLEVPPRELVARQFRNPGLYRAGFDDRFRKFPEINGDRRDH